MLVPVNGEEQQRILLITKLLLFANSQREVMGINFGKATPVPAITEINTAHNRTGQLGTTTIQVTTAGATTNTPIGSNLYIHPPSSTRHQQSPIGLPSFLLTNIQSFGNSEDKDKPTELQATLYHNKIDIACLTETWLTDITKNQVSLDKYTHFSTVRKNAKRAS